MNSSSDGGNNSSMERHVSNPIKFQAYNPVQRSSLARRSNNISVISSDFTAHKQQQNIFRGTHGPGGFGQQNQFFSSIKVNNNGNPVEDPNDNNIGGNYVSFAKNNSIERVLSPLPEEKKRKKPLVQRGKAVSSMKQKQDTSRNEQSPYNSNNISFKQKSGKQYFNQQFNSLNRENTNSSMPRNEVNASINFE
jgi:hypothetical protein